MTLYSDANYQTTKLLKINAPTPPRFAWKTDGRCEQPSDVRTE
jgi:hypothetical protein